MLLHTFLSVVFFLATACSGPSRMGAKKVVPRPYQHDNAHPEDKSPGVSADEAGTGRVLTMEEIRNTPIAFGIRSFEQIFATMAVLTETSSLSSAEDGETIQEKYLNLASQLPESNDAKAFLPSHQVAIAKLAVEYCDVLMDDVQTRSRLFPSVDFNVGTVTSLSVNRSMQFATDLVNQFWGKGLRNRPDEALLNSEITELISALSQGENSSLPESTLNVTKATCSAVLASAPTMFF